MMPDSQPKTYGEGTNSTKAKMTTETQEKVGV